MERHLTTLTDRVARTLAYLSGTAMLLLVVVLVSNAIMTQVGTPFGATYEVVSALGLVVGGLALAETQVHKSHVAIDLVMKRAPKKVQLVVGTVMTVAFAVLFIYLAQGLWAYASAQRATNAATEQLGFPVWILVITLLVGVVGLVIALIGDLFRILGSARDPNTEVGIW